MLEKITWYYKKQEVASKEMEKFLLKELGNNSEAVLADAKEDLSLKFVL